MKDLCLAEARMMTGGRTGSAGGGGVVPVALDIMEVVLVTGKRLVAQ